MGRRKMGPVLPDVLPALAWTKPATLSVSLEADCPKVKRAGCRLASYFTCIAALQAACLADLSRCNRKARRYVPNRALRVQNSALTPRTPRKHNAPSYHHVDKGRAQGITIFVNQHKVRARPGARISARLLGALGTEGCGAGAPRTAEGSLSGAFFRAPAEDRPTRDVK